MLHKWYLNRTSEKSDNLILYYIDPCTMYNFNIKYVIFNIEDQKQT